MTSVPNTRQDWFKGQTPSALVVDTANGLEVGTRGDVVLPRVRTSRASILQIISKAGKLPSQRTLIHAKKNARGFKAEQIVGIEMDETCFCWLVHPGR